MTDHNPNRPVGGLPPERDRLGGGSVPPEHRPLPPRDDRGNSAMALIVGALAVALIIGAFFWFAGDTQDTATLDNPATTQEDALSTDPVPDDDDAVTGDTEQETNITVEPDTDMAEPDTDTTTTTTTTMTEEPAEDAEVIDESQQGATEEPAEGESTEQTQQN